MKKSSAGRRSEITAKEYDPVAYRRGRRKLASMKLLSPPCPVCGKSVPFSKTQFGLGKPFVCESCETPLVIPRNYWIGLGAFLIFWLLKDRMGSPAELVMLLAGLIVMILILSRIFLLPKRA
ncbi:hypothetical protein LCM19_10445 [Qipengyuania flava]|nr:hypothetical protein [Qipengyuania flava]